MTIYANEEAKEVYSLVTLTGGEYLPGSPPLVICIKSGTFLSGPWKGEFLAGKMECSL